MNLLNHFLILTSFHSSFTFFPLSYLGKPEVCSIFTSVATHNHILTSRGKNHEFMRGASTNVPCICKYGTKLQPTSFKNSIVCVIHRPIGFICPFVIGIKAICILHSKFPCTHNSEAWANFIPEFCLNLI